MLREFGRRPELGAKYALNASIGMKTNNRLGTQWYGNIDDSSTCQSFEASFQKLTAHTPSRSFQRKPESVTMAVVQNSTAAMIGVPQGDRLCK
eukprot:TRINITY_DN46443_c0_g1_i1.p2 TRINITY_DN46443_c0_g1~~TRINITY_DN46443_c0_g1_i1.p2  ORF type:complete len:100 (-),score=18.00 TRINITY_DN46443_c0_g1_i1:163-441(-)